MGVIWIDSSRFVAAGGGDPDFANVSLLLHMDGSNGSTTFTDSSSNALTVTANGNAQISTAQSKFGGAGGLLDGNGDSITIPDNAVFDLPGDFTIETWLYANTWPATVYFFGQFQATDFAPVLSYFISGVPGLAASSNDSDAFVNSTSGSALATTTWYHLAWVRSGNRWSIYVDGAERVIAASTAGTPYNSTGSFRIGNYLTGGNTLYNFDGYLDDFRITKGVARYTANFTPPTAAFPDS